MISKSTFAVVSLLVLFGISGGSSGMPQAPGVQGITGRVTVVNQVTEPVLEPVRRVIPRLGMIDISPIVVFIGLRMLQSILLNMAVDS